MRIIEIIPQLSQGGAERFVVDLCNGLVMKGHEVTLIVLHSLDNVGFFAEEIDERVRVVPMNKKMGMDFCLFFRLWRQIRISSPDVVHTHLRGIVYSAIAWLLPSRVKFIHTVHSEAKKEAGEMLSLMFRRLAFKCHRVIPVTISQESEKSFQQLYGRKGILIHNGRPAYDLNQNEVDEAQVEMESMARDKDAMRIVNIARLGEAKNQCALAQAVKQLNEEGYPIELYFIGRKDGTEQQPGPIFSAIQSLLCPHIHFLGAKRYPRAYMYVSDAFCLPSLWEGMPITVIEAFSVGAVPLVTPVGGMKNMVQDNVNGLVSKGCTVDDIKALLIRFMEMSEDDKQVMRVASKKNYAVYSMDNSVEEYLKIMT